MPKITKQLIKAFNVDNRYNRIIDTNFINTSSKDEIVIKFDQNMTDSQCKDYVRDLRSKMIERFLPDEEEADIIFDLQSFPFNLEKGKLKSRKKGAREYVFPIDEGTLFNLKSYLISSFAQPVIDKLPKIFKEEYHDNSIAMMDFDREHFLHSIDFESTTVRNVFINLFQEEITAYDGVPDETFEVNNNEVLVKDIFKDNPQLIESMTERKLWLIGRDLRTSNDEDKYVKEIKERIISFIAVKTGIEVNGIFHAAYLGSEENSLLIPNILDADGEPRWLTQREAKNINKAFGYDVLNDVKDFMTKEQLEELLGKNGKKGIYGINFYDKKISCWVLNKVIESSVINEHHRLSIDSAMQLPPKTLAPPEVERDGASGDSGLGDSPNRGSTIGKSRAGNPKRLLSPDYDGDRQVISGGTSKNITDSGNSSMQSSIDQSNDKSRSKSSASSQPRPKLHRSSAESYTSTSKRNCCIL